MNNKCAHDILEDFQRFMTQHRNLFSNDLIEANGLAILSLEKCINENLVISNNIKQKFTGNFIKDKDMGICYGHCKKNKQVNEEVK